MQLKRIDLRIRSFNTQIWKNKLCRKLSRICKRGAMVSRSRKSPRSWHALKLVKSATPWSKMFSTVVSGTVTIWSPTCKSSLKRNGRQSHRSTTVQSLPRSNNLKTAWLYAWTSTRRGSDEQTSTLSRAIRVILKSRKKWKWWRTRLYSTWRIRMPFWVNLSRDLTRSRLRFTESLKENRKKVKTGSGRRWTTSNLELLRSMIYRMNLMPRLLK